MANLKRAKIIGAYMGGAKLNEAKLEDANLSESNLIWANLSGANCSNSNMTATQLIHTNLENTNLTGCQIFGISAWDLTINNETKQTNLIITHINEPSITVDNVEVAQFIYLLLNNQKIRHVIDTITTKIVLILGRFTPERKSVLDSIREELRKYDYIPVLFDFDKPSTRDTEETITTLTRMAKFIIADISDPKSIPQELGSIVKDLPSVVVQPLLKKGFQPWGMYDRIKRYQWVLDIHEYNDWNDLSRSLKDKLLPYIEEKVMEIRKTL